MTIAIVHYHLHRGGVTRVVEAQCAALKAAGIDHLVLSGSPYGGTASLPVLVVPELDYQRDAEGMDGPTLATTLQAQAREALGTTPDLWHLHNPTLGKNVRFPTMIESLLASDQRLLFHFHDFAEDGRPRNYELLQGVAQLYPLAPQAHYAFINSRDRGLLLDAGLPEERCHLLPNAITPPLVPDRPSGRPNQRLVLYPVRGIRRKNLGEFCLLAALAPAETQFALTLAPANPEWRAIYEDWIEFAETLGLPTLFGVVDTLAPTPGAAPDFESWLQEATHLMTCSVAEGFGLAFLEPIALNKPLLGRALPEITQDFTTQGLKLGSLYENLLVPFDWIDQETLQRDLEEQLRSNYYRYSRSVDEEILDRAWDALLLGDYADFGNLPEATQRDLIERSLHSPDEVMVGIGGECQALQDWLEEALANSSSESTREDLQPYSLARYGTNLRRAYDTLLEQAAAPPQWLPPGEVLEQFLEPERFHFLRT